MNWIQKMYFEMAKPWWMSTWTIFFPNNFHASQQTAKIFLFTYLKKKHFMSKKDNSKLHNNSALRAITLLTERVLNVIYLFFPLPMLQIREPLQYVLFSVILVIYACIYHFLFVVNIDENVFFFVVNVTIRDPHPLIHNRSLRLPFLLWRSTDKKITKI